MLKLQENVVHVMQPIVNYRFTFSMQTMKLGLLMYFRSHLISLFWLVLLVSNFGLQKALCFKMKHFRSSEFY